MKSDGLLIANVDAILKSPYASLPSDEWTWEKVCFSVARLEFGAPAGEGKRVTFQISDKTYVEVGTPSDEWNRAVLSAAAEVRRVETPYYHKMYEDPTNRRRAVSLIVQHLKAELVKSGLVGD